MPTYMRPSAVEAIYSAAANPAEWPDAIGRLADDLGATGGMIVSQNVEPGGRGQGFLTVGRLRDDLTTLYLDQYIRNPYAVALMREPHGKPMVTSGLVEDALVRRTPFHADILAPQKIAGLVVVKQAGLSPTGFAGGFAFSLTTSQMADVDTALSRFARLLPHLARAVDLSSDLGRQRASGLATALLDALPTAAMLLDRTGRLVQPNPAADALLTRGDGLGIDRDGRPVAELPQENRRLWQLLRPALHVAQGRGEGFREALRLSRSSGRASLLLIVTPLPPTTFALWEFVERQARLLVQIVEPEQRNAAAAGLLRRAYDLTGAEARVAALVGSGLSVPQVAETLGSSVNTVRTHLARVFDKTGLRSQAALVQVTANLPNGDGKG